LAGEPLDGGFAVLDPIVLTADELKALRRQQRRAVGRVAERIHYVMLFARGYPIEQIATLYEVDDRTVVSWLERFREGGVAALDDLPRSGRPRLANAAALAEATRCLDSSPEAVGGERTTWTRRLLQRHLLERFACRLSLPSVRRLIAHLGFVWRRPQLGLKPTPGGEAARAASRAIIACARALFPEAAHLYGDECDLHQLPVVRGQYQRRGQQRQIPTPGSNRKQPVIGFLNAQNGAWHYFLPERRRSQEFIACLEELSRLYPQGEVLLYLDHGSIHTSEATLRWLERHPRFLLIHLPAYSGHKSNPVEKVWWALKAQIAANRLYASLEEVQDAIDGFFARFTPETAMRLTAAYIPAPRWAQRRSTEQPVEPLLASA
jgi:transposase